MSTCKTCGAEIEVPEGWSVGPAVRRHYWEAHPDRMNGVRAVQPPLPTSTPEPATRAVSLDSEPEITLQHQRLEATWVVGEDTYQGEPRQILAVLSITKYGKNDLPFGRVPHFEASLSGETRRQRRGMSMRGFRLGAARKRLLQVEASRYSEKQARAVLAQALDLLRGELREDDTVQALFAGTVQA